MSVALSQKSPKKGNPVSRLRTSYRIAASVNTLYELMLGLCDSPTGVHFEADQANFAVAMGTDQAGDGLFLDQGLAVALRHIGVSVPEIGEGEQLFRQFTGSPIPGCFDADRGLLMVKKSQSPSHRGAHSGAKYAASETLICIESYPVGSHCHPSARISRRPPVKGGRFRSRNTATSDLFHSLAVASASWVLHGQVRRCREADVTGLIAKGSTSVVCRLRVQVATSHESTSGRMLPKGASYE